MNKWTFYYSNNSPGFNIALKQSLLSYVKEGKLGPAVLLCSQLGYPPSTTIGREERPNKVKRDLVERYRFEVVRRFDGGYGILKSAGDLLIDLVAPRDILPPSLQKFGTNPSMSLFEFYEFAIEPTIFLLRELGIQVYRAKHDLLLPTEDTSLKVGSGTHYIGTNILEACIQIFARQPMYSGANFIKLVQDLFNIDEKELLKLQRTTFVEDHIQGFNMIDFMEKIQARYTERFSASSTEIPEEVKKKAIELHSQITDKSYVFNGGEQDGKLCYTDIGWNL